MNHLFTYGPVPVDEAEQVPLKETEIGPVPEHWEVVRLEETLRERLKNGHSAKATNTEEGIRTLTLSAVTQNDFSIENTKLTVADPQRQVPPDYTDAPCLSERNIPVEGVEDPPKTRNCC